MVHSIESKRVRHQLQRWGWISAVSLTAAVSAWAVSGQPPVSDMEACTLVVNGQQYTFPVAITSDQQRQGLSHRKDAGAGMMFIWESPTIPAVWMKNTQMPLSAAFIDADGKVVSITDMQPETLNYHYPPSPVVALLETPQGALASMGLTVGSEVTDASCLSFSTDPRPTPDDKES